LSKHQKENIATAVLVHGAGQTHEELLQLMEALATRGFRVILPNLPGGNALYNCVYYAFNFFFCSLVSGTKYTKSPYSLDNKMYGHTLEENMDVLANFIHVLDIKQFS
jgi:dienelactone hydrolase